MTQTDTATLAVQREVLECSRRMYEYESELREGIDKKAQLFLSLLTFFIGSILWSQTFWALVARFRSAAAPTYQQVIVYATMGVLLIAIIAVFSLLLIAVSPRSWRGPLPKSFYSHLFTPSSPHTASEIAIVTYAAQSYAMAAEDFKEGTRIKSRSLVLGSRMIGAVFILTLLLAALLATS